jgi:hypothetical protein
LTLSRGLVGPVGLRVAGARGEQSHCQNCGQGTQQDGAAKKGTRPHTPSFYSNLGSPSRAEVRAAPVAAFEGRGRTRCRLINVALTFGCSWLAAFSNNGRAGECDVSRRLTYDERSNSRITLDCRGLFSSPKSAPRLDLRSMRIVLGLDFWPAQSAAKKFLRIVPGGK